MCVRFQDTPWSRRMSSAHGGHAAGGGTFFIFSVCVMRKRVMSDLFHCTGGFKDFSNQYKLHVRA